MYMFNPLSNNQRAMAAQALMPFLMDEAAARKKATEGRPAKPGLNSDQVSDDIYTTTPTPQDRRAPRAADYAAQLSGVGHSLIYEA
jgi:hypothetical protein